MRHVRNRLLASVRTLPTPRPWLPRVARWTFVAAAAAGVLAFWMASRPVATRLTFQTGSSGVATELGTPLQAPNDAPLAVRFSDGSTFTAAARSRFAVKELSPDGARLRLSEGAMSASVIHRATSRWRIEAGPYTVAVTGTRFVVEWNPRAHTFSLNLTEGAVTIFGPSLGLAGRTVSSPETVRFAPEPSPAPSPAALLPQSAPTTLKEAAPPPRYNRHLATRESLVRPSWIELAHAGRFTDALAAAELVGFAALCRRAPPEDLLFLAKTARFGQRPDRAEEAFRALRDRKDGRHERAVAAFELGRLANDVGQQYRQAADWFATYLQEEPNGALAREAAGRRLEALQRANDLPAAKGAAEHYLGSYPDGPYQSLARRVLRR